ncbi:hypothetical protein LINGRAHAP2_LOCUS30451, partial [Linum grandiflorum]
MRMDYHYYLSQSRSQNTIGKYTSRRFQRNQLELNRSTDEGEIVERSCNGTKDRNR